MVARALALVCLVALSISSASPAQATDDGFPEIFGAEWTDIARNGLSVLPGLVPPGDPGVITGDAALDARIWEIAFARGYEMRPTAILPLTIQDGVTMQSLTASAWESLQAAAAAAGHQIQIYSAYRSVSTQRAIFNSKLAGTSDAAINLVLDYSSPPGASRHHSGYALDIKTVGGTIGSFVNTGAYAWLSANNFANAKRFGFIPSYPADAPLQGPKPEPWEILYVGVDQIRDSDEMFFYRTDGLFRFYDIGPDGALPQPLLAGDGYTAGWTSITSVDLDGDDRDEMFFYRDDGLFRFYDVDGAGALGSPLLAGDGYTTGWTSITSVDLDGDDRDEMFFYRDDGLFRFYNVGEDGAIGSPILEGDGYTQGWSTITSIDLDSDGQDEIFFYREDGLFRFYPVRSDGSLPLPILAGDGYTSGWTSITSVDLDGGGQDEMFFYRDDGLFRYYDVRTDGSLPQPLLAGNGYTSGWTAITSVNLGR